MANNIFKTGFVIKNYAGSILILSVNHKNRKVIFFSLSYNFLSNGTTLYFFIHYDDNICQLIWDNIKNRRFGRYGIFLPIDIRIDSKNQKHRIHLRNALIDLLNIIMYLGIKYSRSTKNNYSFISNHPLQPHLTNYNNCQK